MSSLTVIYFGLAAVLFALALPLALGRVPTNRWYGARIARAYESPESWILVNRLSAYWFIGAACVLFLAGLILRRLEVERLGRTVRDAIEDGAIEADNWTALLDARVMGVTPRCEYRSQSGTWTAIWRTVHRVRTLTEINA